MNHAERPTDPATLALTVSGPYRANFPDGIHNAELVGADLQLGVFADGSDTDLAWGFTFEATSPITGKTERLRVDALLPDRRPTPRLRGLHDACRAAYPDMPALPDRLPENRVTFLRLDDRTPADDRDHPAHYWSPGPGAESLPMRCRIVTGQECVEMVIPAIGSDWPLLWEE